MPGVGGTCVSATNDRAVRDSEGEGPAGPELEKCLKVIDLSMWIVYAREQGSDEEGNIQKRNSCLLFLVIAGKVWPMDVQCCRYSQGCERCAAVAVSE